MKYILKHKIIFLTLGISIFIFLSTFTYYLFFYSKICSGVSIEGVDLSKLNCEEASQKVIENIEIYKSNSICLRAEKKIFYVEYEKIALRISTAESIKEAHQYGKNQDLLVRIKEFYNAIVNGHDIKINVSYDRGLLKQQLVNIKNNFDILSSNAKISILDNKIKYTKEVIGKNILIDESIVIIENKLSHNNLSFDLVIETIKPDIIYDDIKNIDGVLSSYHTKVRSKIQNRDENIKIAISNINDYIIYPNEIFSMNEVLGARSYENGYKNAPVIINDKIVDGVGGGICQVSSTLYCSALLGELEIIERRPHSAILSYIDAGLDATLVEGSIDLKFKNNKDFPILIKSEYKDKLVTVDLFGKTEGNKNVKTFYTQIVKRLPFGESETVYTKNILEDNQIIRSGKEGIIVDVFLNVYNENGVIVNTKHLNQTYYKALNPIIKKFKIE